MSGQYGQNVRTHQHLHNRYSLNPSQSSTNYTPHRLDDADLDYMESQNESDERITRLSDKLTGKVGEEIRQGNGFLSTMNDQFSNTKHILGKTMGDFKIMASKQSASMWCLMTMFIVIIVFVAYYLFFR